MGRGCSNSGAAPLICCEPPFSLNPSLLCKMGLLIPTHRMGEDSVCCCPVSSPDPPHCLLCSVPRDPALRGESLCLPPICLHSLNGLSRHGAEGHQDRFSLTLREPLLFY